MEQNLSIVAKKFWHIVKVAYFMLRKGISKTRLLSDLNTMMKRGKLAGKAAIHNLLFHHHHHNSAAAEEPKLSYPVQLNEYEFSTTTSPAFSALRRLPFLRKNRHSPAPSESEMMEAAMEVASSVAPSPALPGFGRSPALPGFGRTPAVRQLRITDSPFPVRDTGEEDSGHVDEAAEKFIMKFYRDLRRQGA